jgi:DNA-binding LacI/PurR family transcriptional regulator
LGEVRDRPSIVQRVDGFVRAVKRYGLPFSRKEDVVACSVPIFQEGYDHGRELLRRKRKLTAIFCASDLMAAGVLRAAHEQGRIVPADLSVVGFDDITMANYTSPSLTTLFVPKEEMGKRGAACLLELVEGRSRRTTKEVVPVELRVRGSTAAPSAQANERVRVRLVRP